MSLVETVRPALETSRPQPHARGQGPSSGRIRVLYIAGFGRSGSTVLDRLLGEDTRYFSGGELYTALGLPLADRLCSCGARLNVCPFWSSVTERTPELTAPQAMAALDYWLRFSEPRATWRFLLGGERQRILQQAPDGLLSACLALYGSVSHLAGRQVVVDSSKHPLMLLLLAQLPEVELRVVHLVRDPRATAYSWRRRVADRDGTQVLRLGPVKSSFLWTLMHAAVDAVVRAGKLPRRVVRYEDFVSDPQGTLASIKEFAWADTSTGAADASDSDRVVPGQDPTARHLIAGNPMRFQEGPVQVKEDTVWREAGSATNALVTLLTLPFLRRYRYRTRWHRQLRPR